MGINWANLTFKSLGFEGIMNLAVMRFHTAKGRYDTVDLPRPKSVHEGFLMPMLGDYVTQAEPKGYVAALAYLLDGSIAYAQRMAGKKYAVKGGVYPKDFYQTCGYIDADSNIECVDSIIMTHQPEGLFLFQEIPCEDRKKRRFRIIHESARDDRIDAKEREALLAIRKRAIVKSCIQYLQDLGGITGLSEEELAGVVAILEVIKYLDPEAKAIPLRKRRNTKRKDGGEKILHFRGESKNKDDD